MNIKKLSSFLFQRAVIVALLIILQMFVLLVPMIWVSGYYVYVYWACVVLSLLAVLVIIRRQTDPGYKIAWIIPILLFPMFGWLVYLLCGGNKLSARMRRKMQGMDRTMLEQLEGDYKAQKLSVLGPDAVNQARYLERYARCPVYANTWTRYFPLGDDAFPAMLEELKQARHYIFLEYFIIERGYMWETVLSILEEKVREGVEVRLLYDDIGSIWLLPRSYPEEFIQTTTDVNDADNYENTINYVPGEDTLVFDAQGNQLSLGDVKAGDLLTVYTGAYTPAPMIMPPQYQAEIIIIEDLEAESPVFTCADTFVADEEGMLVGLGNTLALNMSEDVEVVDREGQACEAALENMDLLVFYDAATKSVPAQTTPLKVVVLGENELALSNINDQ